MHKHLIFALALVAACGTPPHEAPMPENAVWSDPAFEAAAQELSEADKLMLIHYAARYDEDHLAGLTSFYQSFGDLRDTDDVLRNVLITAAGSRGQG